MVFGQKKEHLIYYLIVLKQKIVSIFAEELLLNSQKIIKTQAVMIQKKPIANCETFETI